MSVLVAGGAGFIGSHFVAHFLKNGYKVTVLDNFVTGHNVHPSATYIDGDIMDVSVFADLPYYDFVVHLASAISVAESMTNPEKYRKSILEGTRNVIEFAARVGVKSVLTASSAAIYGDCGKDPISEDFKFGGISPYAEYKYQTESLGPKCATKFVFCRFFNIFGPRQDPTSPYTGVMSIFIERAIAKKQIIVFGDGEQTRDFVYVKDLVKGSVMLLNNGSEGVFNIGCGKSISIQSLAQICAEMGGSEIVNQAAREGDIKYSLSNPDKMFREVGWKADTPFLEGLKETWRWTKEGDNEGFSIKKAE